MMFTKAVCQNKCRSKCSNGMQYKIEIHSNVYAIQCYLSRVH